MTKSRNLIAKKRDWSADELQLLKALYPFTTCKALTALIHCEQNQIYRMTKKLGLSKSQWFKDSLLATNLRRNCELGKSYRFEKGHVPANKGVKGMPMHPNAVATQFKKGTKPHTTLPIGSLRIAKGDILQRKVSEQSGNNSKRWRGVHELLWIEHNGPVPADHICVFKPGMRTNKLEEITIDRIDCITKAENMRRNSVHKYGKEVPHLHQLKAAITRQINKRSAA